MYGGIPRNYPVKYTIKDRRYGPSIFSCVHPQQLDRLLGVLKRWRRYTLPLLSNVEREIIENGKKD
jgi:hypothetical protein